MKGITNLNSTNDITKVNILKFVFRGIIFFLISVLMVVDKELIINIVNYKIAFLKLYHIIWALLQLEMLHIIIPKFNNHISYGKVFKKFYKENIGYNKELLKELKRKGNNAALKSLVFWAFCLFFVGLIYKFKFIGQIEIYYIVVTAYFLDQFCINIWCPFRSIIVKNKCCNTCRIYNWDRIMYFSALVFIPSFWNYTLLITSFAIFLQWEILANKYPERINEISNLNLRCSYCKSRCDKVIPENKLAEGA